MGPTDSIRRTILARTGAARQAAPAAGAERRRREPWRIGAGDSKCCKNGGEHNSIIKLVYGKDGDNPTKSRAGRPTAATARPVNGG